MPKKMPTLADMPLRPRLEGKYGHDTKRLKSIDDWVNGGANDYVDDPEGTMRLGVNLNASHHIALQIDSSSGAAHFDCKADRGNGRADARISEALRFTVMKS